MATFPLPTSVSGCADEIAVHAQEWNLQTPGLHNSVAQPPQEQSESIAMNASVQPVIAPPAVGWAASLQLGFGWRDGRTVLVRNQHQGPLRVQRPFYPETAGQAHVYILHPPGGIVAGDVLAIEAEFAAGSHGLITTPSAGRVYRTNQARLPHTQHTQLRIAAGGWGEWLPQENIVFTGALARNITQVDIEGDGRFIGWEIACLGRPASQAWFEQGELQQQFVLYHDGKPLLRERSVFVGGSALLQAPWGLQGMTSVGTLLCTANDPALLAELKADCDRLAQTDPAALKLAATALPGLIVVRGLAANAAPLRNAFIACWQRMRLHLKQQTAVAPRIWFT